ncbi:alkyl/aryl-sulfatase [Halosquirtibacter xylanolyticus]|uniref:alkyl/aryl-sulfatase n=1 Tax=Halosquirtibacter xylanolyticus TaxID=3374599 RepID=UPI00374786A8|nr:alkyl/aryl-sulfatase [Prolixibacteraceae bacterium]
MKKMNNEGYRRFRTAMSLALMLLLTTNFSCKTVNSEKKKEHPNLTKLKAHSSEFTPEIIALGHNVYTAVGFDGSNTSMIVGEDGVIIIDALRALGAAEKVAVKFREITPKPVKAIVYTHGHGDHTGGASAFITNEKDVIIIAREGFKEELQDLSPVGEVLKRRNARQFGRNLPKKDIINRGVAPGYTSKDRVGQGYLPPNRTFNDSLFIKVAGVQLELYAADGETNDQLFVWTPQLKTLFSGDNYYKAFPNLYAIRGSRYRDVKEWGESIMKMSGFPVEHLVPGHTRPLSGKHRIHQCLDNYGTAILSVYDQTIKCMNDGYSLQQTVDHVKLPKTLAEQPNLQEFYGMIPWGVRSIYLHYVGWFDGSPSNLLPLSEMSEAKHMIEMVGGERKMLQYVKDAIKESSFQWALQLTDYLVCVGYEKAKVIDLRILILKSLASQQLNAPARNYYLSCAYELEN